ncbi:hypothetical protein K461DRAFT_315945 [Myriangium duriaei CBS 260.36]|uniref:Protein kinase domain-containing protein n=1 Tax=Myriangium duriaei CBS 260.36 TaxID=1168546 RepID=A0A9P4IYE1_9PEZI|nr:hypothetical protein K461DRAFT_315945 [Myriangium duriaei CBS 260.36]
MSHIELLSCLIEDDGEGAFRLLINGTTIKYVIIEGGIYERMDMCFGPRLAELLPPFPPEDWRLGLVSKRPEDGTPYFEIVDNRPLQGIRNTWHPNEIDHLRFSLQVRLKSNVWEATATEFEEPVILKFATLLWEIHEMEDETEAYSWIRDLGIGPKFLGHLTEDDGRVYGMILEKITDARHAEARDLPACKDALQRLHALGILHGDINRFNFLIKEGKATLLDFCCARKSTDPEEFAAELNEVEGALESESNQD